MRKLPMTDDSTMDRYREKRTDEVERVQGSVEDATGETDAKSARQDSDEEE
jgi:hypothetical protein